MSSDDPIFLQGADKPDLSGSQIFDISSRNIFNRAHHHIYITIHQSVFDKVLEDGAAGIASGYGLVDELVLNGEAIKNVGIKVRGNTSASQAKRQFKLKFDATKAFGWRNGAIADVALPPENDDRRFFGENGFSIRASNNDPSRVRELISGKVFREAALGGEDDKDGMRPWRLHGGLVYRAGFATLYVTNGRRVEEGRDGAYPGYRVEYNGRLYDPKGLYLVTENIDKTFIKTRFERFPNEKVKGYLFNCDKGLASFDKSDYSRVGWKLVMAKGKKAKDEKDFSKGDEKILDLISFLDSKPSEADIRDRFDLDSVNGYLAGALMTTHWDSLVANRNNDFMFYLKRDVLTADMKPVLDADGKEVEEKKWYVITWDLDNTLWDVDGAKPEIRDPYKDWFSNYLYQPARKEANKTKLIDVIYAKENAGIRKEYDEVLRNLLDGYCSKSSYEQKVDYIQQRVADAIEDTRQAVSKAGWQTEWGEYNDPKDFEIIKNHASARRYKINSQL